MIAIMISALLALPPVNTERVQEAPIASSVSAPSGERAATSNNPDNGNNMVCRRERIMGSNRSEQVCMTLRERESRRANARDMRDMRDDTRGDGRRFEPTPDASDPK